MAGCSRFSKQRGARADPPAARKCVELRRANAILRPLRFFATELDQTAQVSAFIDSHRERFSVGPICEVLGASRCVLLGLHGERSAGQ